MQLDISCLFLEFFYHLDSCLFLLLSKNDFHYHFLATQFLNLLMLCCRQMHKMQHTHTHTITRAQWNRMKRQNWTTFEKKSKRTEIAAIKRMCLSSNDEFSTELKTKQKFNHDPVFIFTITTSSAHCEQPAATLSLLNHSVLMRSHLTALVCVSMVVRASI